MRKGKTPAPDARSLILEALKFPFWNDAGGKGAPLRVKWKPADSPDSRLAICTGENGSGKSLFRKAISGICRSRSSDLRLIHISMQGRCAGGIKGGLLYGAESYISTGYNSVRVVEMSISACAQHEESHVLFLDEPDIGMSDSCAAGTGKTLCKFALSLGPLTRAVFIISHNRHLVRALLGADPHYLGFGLDAPATLEEWTARDIIPVDVNGLQEQSHRNFLLIEKALDVPKKRKGK